MGVHVGDDAKCKHADKKANKEKMFEKCTQWEKEGVSSLSS